MGWCGEQLQQPNPPCLASARSACEQVIIMNQGDVVMGGQQVLACDSCSPIPANACADVGLRV